MQNYIELALVTKSDKFYGEIVPADMLIEALGDAITALKRIDDIKKAIFYRKLIAGVSGAFTGSNKIASGWLGKDYIIDNKTAEDIIHAILGIASEAGELLELLDDTLHNGKFDAVNFKEEIGDVMWYQAIGLNAIGEISFNNTQYTNIAKLQKRFGDKFTEHFAKNRDLVAEREVLEVSMPVMLKEQMNTPDFEASIRGSLPDLKEKSGNGSGGTL